MKLSRRDCCALALALECLRRPGWRDLKRTMLEVQACLDLADHGSPLLTTFPYGSYPMRLARVVRARLALFIRATLRADRGDCGPPLCQCGRPMVQHSWVDGGWSHEWATECVSDEDHELMPHPHWVGPVRALWEQAPPHGGG